MSSALVFDSMLSSLLNREISFADDVFFAMLVTSAYAPRQSHSRRAHVTSEAEGPGYEAGGAATPVRVAQTADGFGVVFGDVVWPSTTISASGAVIYRRTGDPSLDDLIAYVDFGSELSAVGSAFLLTFSRPMAFRTRGNGG